MATDNPAFSTYTCLYNKITWSIFCILHKHNRLFVQASRSNVTFLQSVTHFRQLVFQPLHACSSVFSAKFAVSRQRIVPAVIAHLWRSRSTLFSVQQQFLHQQQSQWFTGLPIWKIRRQCTAYSPCTQADRAAKGLQDAQGKADRLLPGKFGFYFLLQLQYFHIRHIFIVSIFWY